MTRRLLFLTVVPPLLLAACTVGPNYHGPPPDQSTTPPAQFKNAAAGSRQWKLAEPRDKEARGPWWRVFHDATLDGLENQALSANQDLRLAAGRIREARAQARVAAADFYPNVNGQFDATRQRTSNNLPIQKARTLGGFPGMSGGAVGGAGGGSSGFTLSSQPLTRTYDFFRAPFDLAWEIDLFGRVRRSYEAARDEAQGAEADAQSMALTVTANVASSYFTLRAFDAEIGVLEHTIGTRREALRIANERLQAGLTGELDVSRARSELANNEAELAAVNRQRAELENSLATLLGQPASTLRLARRPFSGSPPRVPPGLPSRLLERRPDIAAAERQLAAENARIGIATAAFFPEIKLTGNAGFESQDITSLFNWQSRVWSLGPSVTLPIFTGGRNTANLNAARARYEQGVAQYRQRVLVGFQEVENSLADLRQLALQAEAQNRAIEASQRTLELAQDAYSKGRVNFLDVLDAERTLLQGQRVATQLLGQRMQATVQLIKALGGDWQ